MNRDRAYGAVILVGSLAGLAAYTWLLYVFPLMMLQITAFLAVAAVLVILAWIGWTMATTPPPAPIELPEAETTSTPAPTSEKPST